MTDAELVRRICTKLKIGAINPKTGNVTFSPDGIHIKTFDFNDPRCWMLVVEMMRKIDGNSGFNFNLNWQGHPGISVCLAQFHKIDPFTHGQGADDNPGRSVLMAADKALGGDDE